jgi:hypothetical protein
MNERSFRRRVLAATFAVCIAPTNLYAVQFAADVAVGAVSVQLRLVNTISGSSNANPLYGTYAPGDTRLFLVQQGTNTPNPDIEGKVLYVNPAVTGGAVGTLLDFSVKLPGFLDITHFEKGLLALAFHPDFNDPAKPGYLKFYTYTNENYAQSAAAYGPVLDFKHPETAASLPIPNPLPQNWINNVATLREWTANSATPTDATPSRVLMRIADPQNQHNGGTLAFSPSDGYLYWSLGDGGGNSSNSPEFDNSKGGINSTTDGHTNMTVVDATTIYPHGNAQDRTTPLGKILRINPLSAATAPDQNATPSANGQYQIPNDNPFTIQSNIDPNTMNPYADWNATWVDEIYAYGLRNPYRFSFDRGDGGANVDRGKLYLADAGWDDREEVDLIEKGNNYGWVIREGTQPMAGTFAGTANEIPVYTAPVNAHTGLPDTLTDPIAEYHESVGVAIIGGFVSRQSSTNGLFGKYVFGDWQSPLRSGDGLLLYFDTNEVKDPDAPFRIYRLNITGATQLPAADLLGFGEGANGAIYAMFDNGQIYELLPQAIPLPGDYNNDHVVDASDYVVWRDHYGTNEILLNDAIGGTIGDGQYNQWRANFGKSIATGGSGAAVAPEPASVLLILMPVVCSVLAARRRCVSTTFAAPE